MTYNVISSVAWDFNSPEVLIHLYYGTMETDTYMLVQSGSLIMNYLCGPNLTVYIGFVLGRVRLLWSLLNMNRFFGPQGVHNKRPWLYILNTTQTINL